MSIKMMHARELLSLNKFNIDEEQPHIVVDKEICAKCQEKPCLVVCPAGLYTLENNQLFFDYVGCLECGTCRLMCKNKGITKWQYPRGKFGVIFRKG